MLYFLQLMHAGGAMMWLILACSLIAMFIVLERLFHFHRAELDVEEFLHGLFNILKRNNVVEAVSICDETPGPVAHLLRAAILRGNQDEQAVRQAIEETSIAEMARLERNMSTLATMAHIAPLLGFLGTVLGVIGAFQAMQDASPFVSTVDLAEYIQKALITTAAGLCVAIPAYAFYNFLVSRIQGFALDMEKAASEMVFFLSHNKLTLDNVPGAVGAAGADTDDDRQAAR